MLTHCRNKTDETQGDQGVFSICEKNKRYVTATRTENIKLYTENDSYDSWTTNQMLIEDLSNGNVFDTFI